MTWLCLILMALSSTFEPPPRLLRPSTPRSTHRFGETQIWAFCTRHIPVSLEIDCGIAEDLERRASVALEGQFGLVPSAICRSMCILVVY
jgi:hypothetical protein